MSLYGGEETWLSRIGGQVKIGFRQTREVICPLLGVASSFGRTQIRLVGGALHKVSQACRRSLLSALCRTVITSLKVTVLITSRGTAVVDYSRSAFMPLGRVASCVTAADEVLGDDVPASTTISGLSKRA